jgi:hypothetical protein
MAPRALYPPPSFHHTIYSLRPLSFDGFGKVVGIVVARRNAMYLLMSNDYRVYYADVANAKMS